MRPAAVRFACVVCCLLAVLLVACATSGRIPTSGLEGYWWEAGDDTIYTLLVVDGELRVVEAFCRQDGEVYRVRSSGWNDHAFTWTIEVPSTGYVVTCEVTDFKEGSMSVRWTNEFASGTDVLLRMDSKE